MPDPSEEAKAAEEKAAAEKAAAEKKAAEENGDLFNSEQQAKVQSLIDDAYKRAYTKALRGTASTERIAELEATIEGLKKTKDGVDTPDRDLTLLKDKNTAITAENKALRTKGIRADIVEALDGADIFNLNQVISLVSGHVKHNDDGILTINSDSGIFMNVQGQQGNLKEFVADYLGKNENLLKSSGRPGSGGGRPEDVKIVSISRADYNAKTDPERREFLKAGGEIV